MPPESWHRYQDLRLMFACKANNGYESGNCAHTTTRMAYSEGPLRGPGCEKEMNTSYCILSRLKCHGLSNKCWIITQRLDICLALGKKCICATPSKTRTSITFAHNGKSSRSAYQFILHLIPRQSSLEREYTYFQHRVEWTFSTSRRVLVEYA